MDDATPPLLYATTKSPALVESDWLQARLNVPDIKILDCGWFYENTGRDAHIEYELRHIPGAVHFDIDDVCDPAVDLPHMVPSAEVFAGKISRLGISNRDTVVVYDSAGGFSAAARVWWMFRLFGHHNVCMLNGGLFKWYAEKRPMEDGVIAPQAAVFEAKIADFRLLRNRSQMIENLTSRAEVILDARSPGRFDGSEPEPRPAKRTGHIPGSVNLFFADLMEPRDSYVMCGQAKIRQVFMDAGIDIERPMAITCGTGVTACVLAFALYLLGIENVPLYDGSWAEWGDDLSLPIDS